MDSNYSGNPNKKGSEEGQAENEEVCTHSVLQAEQCAMITHYNGKCEILRGETTELKLVRRELISRGLKATIE